MKLMDAEQKRMLVALVASRPGLRTVEIADVMDCNIQCAEVALADLVGINILSAHEVIAPNTRAALAYTLSGVALPDKPAVVAPAAPTKPAMTNVDKAVEFIAANDGEATSAQLHALLGLKSTEYASSYLKGGLDAGRLVNDGKTWTLGGPAPAVEPAAAPIAAAPAPLAQVSAPAPIPARALELAAAQAAASPAPSTVADSLVPPRCFGRALLRDMEEAMFIEAAPTIAVHGDVVVSGVQSDVEVAFSQAFGAAPAGEPKGEPMPAAAPAKVSYALWSDGSMHFARGGATVFELSKDEAKKMFAYLENFTAD